MADLTQHYGLQKLTSGDAFSINGYKFTDADRDLIDRLLRASLTHDHTGSTASSPSVGSPLGLSVSNTGGTLTAGITVYYVYTLVDQYGSETEKSTEASISTPAPIGEPGAATLSTVTTGGTLKPGSYYYALSAYKELDQYETTATLTSYILVPLGTSTNVITLTLPELPAGADGFNVYRRGVGQTQYFYLDSIDMTAATPPTTYVDDGSVEENCDRIRSAVNSTRSTNKITITFPGATPVVPAGYTWKIYRTFLSGGESRWVNTLLHHVVEESSPGVIEVEFEDLGYATGDGTPPTQTTAVDMPAKINLEDATEVQNRLPTGHVQAFPLVVNFVHAGILEPTVGTKVWLCEFPYARIVGCRAALDVGSSPASQDVIIDVNKYDAQLATPTSATIYTTQANRPRITVGDQIGDRAIPDVVDLFEGDYLTVDIDQEGAGATPTDNGLVVSVVLLVQMSNTVSDFDWS